MSNEEQSAYTLKANPPGPAVRIDTTNKKKSMLYNRPKKRRITAL